MLSVQIGAVQLSEMRIYKVKGCKRTRFFTAPAYVRFIRSYKSRSSIYIPDSLKYKSICDIKAK